MPVRQALPFTARAGMNRKRLWLHEGSTRVPRPRGDEPPILDAWEKGVLRSPPARG